MRRVNAVRVTVKSDEAAGDGAIKGSTTTTGQRDTTTGMNRLEFSRAVLQRGMGFVPIDLNCLVKPPSTPNSFEVSFKTPQLLEQFWTMYRQNKNNPPFSHLHTEPLSDRENKVVTIQFHNEAVQEYDVEVWLRRYARVNSGARRVLDEDGVWTGARKWLVQLTPDPSAVGGVQHIPSTINLGNHRGTVHYYGMPKLCRTCGHLGHLAAACTNIICRICRGEHPTAECTNTQIGRASCRERV